MAIVPANQIGFSQIADPATRAAFAQMFSLVENIRKAVNANVAPPVVYLGPTAWTPVVKFGGSSVGITYTTQQAKYLRVNDVILWAISRLTLSNKGAQVGVATIDGFPIASANNYSFKAGYFTNFGAGVNTVGGYTVGTALQLINEAAGAYAPMTDADFTNTSDLIAAGWYSLT